MEEVDVKGGRANWDHNLLVAVLERSIFHKKQFLQSYLNAPYYFGTYSSL